MSGKTGNESDLLARDSKLYCSAEWHFARFKSKTAGLVHAHALRIARESENYYCSIPQMAAYFDKAERTIREAFHELEKTGFFEVIRQEDGKAVNYRPVSHTDWAATHPNQCVEKLKMPWEGEGDPLGRALYSVSGSRVTFFPNVLKGLRKHGFSDGEIVAELKQFLSEQDLLCQPRIVNQFNEYLRMKKADYSQRPLTMDVRGTANIGCQG